MDMGFLFFFANVRDTSLGFVRHEQQHVNDEVVENSLHICRFRHGKIGNAMKSMSVRRSMESGDG